MDFPLNKIFFCYFDKCDLFKKNMRNMPNKNNGNHFGIELINLKQSYKIKLKLKNKRFS